MYAGSTSGNSSNASSGNTNTNSNRDNNAPTAYSSNAIAEANDLDALVFEFGTSKCKFGYAGEDFPRVYESPLASQLHNDPSFTDPRHLARCAASMETDYEQIAQWLFDASSTRLQTKLSEHPLLVVERPFPIPNECTKVSGDDVKAEEKVTNHPKRDVKARERMVQILMESVDVPALFCAKSSVLTCYANARTSGLVVEMGATYTSVTSVQEGYSFTYPKSQVVVYGGNDIDAFLEHKLANQLAAQPSVTFGSRFYWNAVIEAKESGLCRVADGPFEEAQNAQLPKIAYELPDKTVLQLGTERFSAGEQYFHLSTDSQDIPIVETGAAPKTIPRRGINLPELICETGAITTETELRKELFQNIVLTGGSSCFDGMSTRLEREIVVSLGTFAPTSSKSGVGLGNNNLRVKLMAAHAPERRIGSFLGGSILASLGSFHEMWMSKAEYAEHGAALIHKKCP